MTSDDRELPDRDVLRYNVSLYDSLMDLNEAVDTAKTVMSAWSDRLGRLIAAHKAVSVILAVCIVTTTVGVVQQRIEESKPEYHYSVKQAETPDTLLAATGTTLPSYTWMKDCHGGPDDRTITLQLQFEASCVPATADVKMSQDGYKGNYDMALTFPMREDKRCDDKKWEWTWWTVSVPDGGVTKGGLLPLDEVTHVSVAWDRWPNGGYSDLPQWKTQMDKVDYGQ